MILLDPRDPMLHLHPLQLPDLIEHLQVLPLDLSHLLLDPILQLMTFDNSSLIQCSLLLEYILTLHLK